MKQRNQTKHRYEHKSYKDFVIIKLSVSLLIGSYAYFLLQDNIFFNEGALAEIRNII